MADMAAEKMTNGCLGLYVVPTPLGNLSDLSTRAAEVLRSVSWVAAEDTRHSGTWLRNLGSAARLLPAHQHNENTAARQVIEKLAAGESVALISDAGTPGISDPGARIVAEVRAAGFRIIPLPGPCAAVTALSAAGLEDPHFLFYGFLPSKASQRRETLKNLQHLPYALVFYEAPHRILETTADLAEVLAGTPERTLVIARELTKLFEQIEVLPLSQGLAWLEADPNHQRGEFVLIVSGAPSQPPDVLDGEAERVLRTLLDDGLSVRQASKLAATLTGAGKSLLYQRALALKS